jgi:transposase-like protein
MEEKGFLPENLRNGQWNSPVRQSQIAHQLCINGNMFVWWKREVKQGETGPVKTFTGSGKARDEEVTRLRQENADLRETNEILKKAFVHLHDTKSQAGTSRQTGNY